MTMNNKTATSAVSIKFGNAGDTRGATVKMGVVLHATTWDPKVYVITDGEKVGVAFKMEAGWYDCTNSRHPNKPGWTSAFKDWGISHKLLAEAQNFLATLPHPEVSNIRSDDFAEQMATEFARSLSGQTTTSPLSNIISDIATNCGIEI